MLYTLIGDDGFRGMVFDSDAIDKQIGTQEQGCDMFDRIEINHMPRPFKDLFSSPLPVSFPVLNKDDKNKPLPDIDYERGRLFLTPKAYKILKPLLEQDGEFIPVTYEHGEAYFFNPLRKAEDVEGLNEALSVKNEWMDVENLAFHEEKLKDWAVFRTAFDSYMTLQIQDSVKEAIEGAKLTGVYITPDLGRIFPSERSDVEDIN